MEPVRCANCQSLQRRVHDLQAENERLRCELDAALRAGKRQAGPFSKGEPKATPKSPGRKPGKDYGTKAHADLATGLRAGGRGRKPGKDYGTKAHRLPPNPDQSAWVVPDETGWRVGGHPA